MTPCPYARRMEIIAIDWPVIRPDHSRKVCTPQRPIRIGAVSLKSVEHVLLGCDEDNVVRSLAAHRDSRDASGCAQESSDGKIGC